MKVGSYSNDDVIQKMTFFVLYLPLIKLKNLTTISKTIFLKEMQIKKMNFCN